MVNSLKHITFTQQYYVRSGYVYANYGTLRFAGVYGDGWSRLGRSDVRYAYGLLFNSSDVDPSYNNDRYIAFPVHCDLIQS